MTKKRFAVVLASWGLVCVIGGLMGCVTTPHEGRLVYAQNLMAKDEYYGAFVLLKQVLIDNTTKNDAARAKALALAEPRRSELAAGGVRGLTPENYTALVETYGEERADAEFSDTLYVLALLMDKSSFSEVERSVAGIKSKAQVVYVNELVWPRLTASEQKQLEARYTLRVAKVKDVGIILERQSQNASTPGSSAGSQLGAAVGSAAYIDKAFAGPPSKWSYSATGNLGAQVAGAVIGGAVGDMPAKALYISRYTLRHPNGAVSYKQIESTSPLGHTAGLCFHSASEIILPDYSCEADSAGLRKAGLL